MLVFKFLIVLFLISASASAVNNVFLTGPSIGFPQETSIKIWWNVQNEETEHFIYYGNTPESMTMVAKIAIKTKYPAVMLSNLSPDTKYYYYVRSGNLVSQISHFIIKQQDNLRFAIWADNQDGEKVFSQVTVPVILSANPDYLIGVGDLVQHGDNYIEWMSQFYGPARKMLSSIPFIPARGNHDGESLLAKSMLPFPNNAGFYATIIKNIYIVILDTNLNYEPGSVQYNWFMNVVSTPEWKNAKYRIVAFHHPPFTNRWSFDLITYDGESGVRDYLVPIIESSGTEIVLNGHAHCYEHGIRKNNYGQTHYFTVGGGGGSIDKITTGNWEHIVNTQSIYHVALMDVTPTNIVMTIFNTANGKIEDRISINSNNLTTAHSIAIAQK